MEEKKEPKKIENIPVVIGTPKELLGKIEQAVKSNKYFITITCDIGGRENMKHYWITQNFNDDQLLPTLEYFKDDLNNKVLRKPKENRDWK